MPHNTTLPIDWVTVNKAFFDWVTDQINVEAIWEEQRIPQPPYPYISLQRTAGPVREGGRDEERSIEVANRPNGQEIDLLTTGPRLITVTVQYHAGGLEIGGNLHDNDAIAHCSLLQASLSQRSVLDALRDAGIAVVNEGTITDLSEAINGEWISRAALDPQFRVISCVTERTGFIESVEVSSEIGNAVGSLDLNDLVLP